MLSLDRVLITSPTIRVGAFRCAVGDPRFRDSGPIQNHLVAFPRTGVWIRQAGSRPLVADARTVTIYNQGREYGRKLVSPHGDRCDWFAVAPDVALSIAEEHDPRPPGTPEQAFRFEWATSDARLYVRQRRLFLRLERGAVSRLEAEEEVIRLVGDVLARAAAVAGATVASVRPSRRAAEARRDLVERARAELARAVAEPTDVTTLATRLGTSPYHLCRVFRQETGFTLHGYRLDLRLRAAVERLAEPGVRLSRVAFELGFSSHSHFSAVLRRCHGVTPRSCQAELLGAGGQGV